MSLVLKYKNFIDKMISDMKEDICKKITQDASVCNNVVDLILEYSDEYDINPEYDIYYYKTKGSYGLLCFDKYNLVISKGDLVMTEEKLKYSWTQNGMIWGPGENRDNFKDISQYNSMIKTIEGDQGKEIHIWMGESKRIDLTTIRNKAKEIVAKIEEMYPEMKPKIDMVDSPSLTGDEDDLVIVLII